MNRIVIGSDHGALELKDELIRFLKAKGCEVTDMGTHSAVSVDYPDIAEAACKEYKQGGYTFGILLCGTGIGISMSANKVKGIRCALVGDLFSAQMAKAHNNANFIAFGGRIHYATPVTAMVDRFMQTDYEGGRHEKRIQKMMALEELP